MENCTKFFVLKHFHLQAQKSNLFDENLRSTKVFSSITENRKYLTISWKKKLQTIFSSKIFLRQYLHQRTQETWIFWQKICYELKLFTRLRRLRRTHSFHIFLKLFSFIISRNACPVKEEVIKLLLPIVVVSFYALQITGRRSVLGKQHERWSSGFTERLPFRAVH